MAVTDLQRTEILARLQAGQPLQGIFVLLEIPIEDRSLFKRGERGAIRAAVAAWIAARPQTAVLDAEIAHLTAQKNKMTARLANVDADLATAQAARDLL